MKRDLNVVIFLKVVEDLSEASAHRLIEFITQHTKYFVLETQLREKIAKSILITIGQTTGR
jgi:hypothetical protein